MFVSVRYLFTSMIASEVAFELVYGTVQQKTKVSTFVVIQK